MHPDSDRPVTWADGAYFTFETLEAAMLQELGFTVQLLDQPDGRGRFGFKVTEPDSDVDMRLRDAVRAMFNPDLWHDDAKAKVLFYQAVTQRATHWRSQIAGRKAEARTGGTDATG